ncbi:MAG: sigma-54-dependent Fis family transcriptional regulator [Ignavibacteriales bacterium]|nr:sigma-54-dependent Fis family transcriptional regulator [Ignavibacteriales bacterium]MCB9210698.1 sigma-54-dependent Fis family transcriptional regulator [Ignavibacteriales bacterium]MCB9219659.1 sigma-54-dependent Fis family transcriptional regulator [Ignavibacteriales bacterium]MCB9259953.1 sigma-54-dependent Fis family transcriptional regulator [Ignavibacteriales bacterium]
MNEIRILLIEDEDFDARRVKNTIALMGNKIRIVEIVSNGNDALNILKKNVNGFDIIIMDYQIVGGLRGEELIKQIKKMDPTLQIIVITKLTIDMTDFDFANKLIEAGAFWYCTKYPGDIEKYIYQPTDFLMSIFNAFEKKRLETISHNSNRKLNHNVEQILEQKKLIGSSEETNDLKEKIERYSKTDVNILIYGASGTGKELVANNIHYKSNRKLEKFVPINCGGLPNDLIESELFGYEKGAFTGANTKKLGLFEIANNGTIFLDEIAELPQTAQVKLLRVIQEGEIEKIGRTDRIKVNVRIIAATNKNLANLVSQNLFREDLFYRLNVVPIQIQTLSNRRKDIPDLVEHFLERFSWDMGIRIPELGDDAKEYLVNYSWPGNVRELKNVIQRVLFLDKKYISSNEVKNSVVSIPKPINNDNQLFNFTTLSEVEPLRDIEKKFRQEYFDYVRENSISDAEAAKKLGLAPPNYYRMSKELGLK